MNKLFSILIVLAIIAISGCVNKGAAPVQITPAAAFDAAPEAAPASQPAAPASQPAVAPAAPVAAPVAAPAKAPAAPALKVAEPVTKMPPVEVAKTPAK